MKVAYYDFDVQNAPKDVFYRINVDWFDAGLGKSSVHVTMSDNVFLPPLLLPAEIYVDLKDTILDRYIPGEAQERPTKNTYDNHVIFKVPVSLLHYQKDRAQQAQEKLKGANDIYSRLNVGTREFTFNTPNVLDSAMTAFFFTKVMAPILKKIQSS